MKHRMLVLVAIFFTAIAAPAQKWHSLSYRADAPGIDENPLRGFVPYSSAKYAPGTFPYSLEWFYLPLNSVVTGPNTYDWTPVEAQLKAISARGHQAIFRFYVDYPHHPTGLPKYLLDAGLKTYPYDDDGNDKGPTPSVSPDYTDPRLIDGLVQFIHAFGAKYDGDPRIAYLTVGLYGFWGEWHVHKHPTAGEPAGWAISQASKDALLQAYVESFHHTLLDVRYGGVTPDHALLSHFGFHDDSFFHDTLGPENWQFWPTIVQAEATENWKKYPMGGEIYPQTQVGLWTTWPSSNGSQDVVTSILTTHMTWMMDSKLFTSLPTDAERANALRADRMMGYTLFCKQFSVKKDTVTVQIENRGVAPFYYAWPVEAVALNAAGKEVGKGTANWPLPSLLPGHSADWSMTLDALPKSATTMLLRIANPMQGGHPVAFANAEMSTVRDGWLTLSLK
jgi:hypothetical protein